ncbi:superoxide dismutase [Candidatus Babela massiliensis]|uniref:superoxide dismutase n=1 Tax=Candidatus Babela massiliensis TaxID=673862 RepID=V6DFI4_9BACT|nr:superoxide dismutase [Candidatus Babela massiliensis]CDK30309.1 Superoxide dismutase [Candidatus Babela massiliensis]
MSKRNIITLIFIVTIKTILTAISFNSFTKKETVKDIIHENKHEQVNLNNNNTTKLLEKKVNGKFVLPPLPYKYNALEPYIDAKTMELHYTKHHQAYADGLNKALEKHPELKSMSVEELITHLDTVPQDIRTEVRNNGGGYLNHSMFWLMMSPHSGEPKPELAKAINKSFGSFGNFKQQFNETAKKVFGSGWAWLCLDKEGNLVITKSKDQDNPITNGYEPILGLDVWEHAYYLKYQNKRFEYIDAWWNVVDWNHIENNYKNAVDKISKK